MTTTVAFATRGCLVLGCDSLGTVTAKVVNPFSFLSKFFDPNDNYNLRTDQDGNPILQHFKQVYEYAEDIAYNQVPSMTKIFSLEPAAAGLVFAGISALSDRSIPEIVSTFVEDQTAYLQGEYQMEELANRLCEHIKPIYDDAYNNRVTTNLELELTLGGYSSKEHKPEVLKIIFSSGDGNVHRSLDPGQYDVVFGGQYDIVQRVVTGLDWLNVERFRERVLQISAEYRTRLQEHLTDQNVTIDLPEIIDYAGEIHLDDVSWINRSDVDLANFSEQAGIDFVDFLVDTMIKAQHFSNRLQTVGGKVHVALVTKSDGFRWISKEEYTHKGHGVPKHNAKLNQNTVQGQESGD